MADNNEMFELLTKIYSEFQSMKSDVNERFDTLESRFDNLETRFDNMEDKVDNLESGVRKTNMTIENEIKPKIEALFDGYKQSTEAIYELTDKVDYLQSDINNLTIRTLKNENNIIHLSKH